MAQTVPVNNQKSVRFKIQAPPKLAPKARVIVYYVRVDGEIVADTLDFDVEGVFQTPVISYCGCIVIQSTSLVIRLV